MTRSTGGLNSAQRLLVWLLTGPVGRFVAFFADLGVYWWRWLRGREADPRSR